MAAGARTLLLLLLLLLLRMLLADRAADFGATAVLMPRFAAAFFIKLRSSSFVGILRGLGSAMTGPLGHTRDAFYM